jgi:hypothetical protein
MSQTKAQLIGNVPGGAVFTGIVTATSANIGGNIGINSTGISAVGVITATGFVGNVTGNLTGTASTATAAGTAYGLTGSISGSGLTSLNASNLSSGTVPDARFPATLPSASGANLTSLNASNLSSGTVATARLASGTANSGTYLRGDQTWAAISSGITITDDTSTDSTFYPTFTSATSGTITGETVSSSKLTFNPSSGTFKAPNIESFVTSNTYLGVRAEGGYLICRSASVGWIVAPGSSEVSRNWYCRDDANTTAQSISGCTGWFVPTVSQLQNPGYTCRTFWDSFSSATYWSSTEVNAHRACTVNFNNGNADNSNKGAATCCVRAFRCVTY